MEPFPKGLALGFNFLSYFSPKGLKGRFPFWHKRALLGLWVSRNFLRLNLGQKGFNYCGVKTPPKFGKENKTFCGSRKGFQGIYFRGEHISTVWNGLNLGFFSQTYFIFGFGNFKREFKTFIYFWTFQRKEFGRRNTLLLLGLNLFF